VARLFWDTSALVRRYATHEPGAPRVRAATGPASGHSHLMSRLVTVELASALTLKVRTGQLTADQRDVSWRLFQRHLQRDYVMLQLSDQVWLSAEDLLFRHALRAADAIHLATALIAGAGPDPALIFWTADRRQAEAAAAEGLDIELVS
jgi:uncharacterized protein